MLFSSDSDPYTTLIHLVLKYKVHSGYYIQWKLISEFQDDRVQERDRKCNSPAIIGTMTSGLGLHITREISSQPTYITTSFTFVYIRQCFKSTFSLSKWKKLCHSINCFDSILHLLHGRKFRQNTQDATTLFSFLVPYILRNSSFNWGHDSVMLACIFDNFISL